MDAKATVVKSLRNTHRIFSQDIAALPEEAMTKHFGGTTRTVADIVYEVNLVTDHVGLTISGGELFDWPEGWIKAPAGFETKKEISEAFDQSMQKVIDMAESYTSEFLLEPFQTDDGETTRFERFRFIVLHIWYHSGQLNFMQGLLGDDEWHWK